MTESRDTHTTISVSPEFRDRLAEQCSKGQTYEDRIREEFGWNDE